MQEYKQVEPSKGKEDEVTNCTEEFYLLPETKHLDKTKIQKLPNQIKMQIPLQLE